MIEGMNCKYIGSQFVKDTKNYHRLKSVGLPIEIQLYLDLQEELPDFVMIAVTEKAKLQLEVFLEEKQDVKESR